MKSIARQMFDRMYFHRLFHHYRYGMFDNLNRRAWGSVGKHVYNDLYVHGRP